MQAVRHRILSYFANSGELGLKIQKSTCAIATITPHRGSLILAVRRTGICKVHEDSAGSFVGVPPTNGVYFGGTRQRLQSGVLKPHALASKTDSEHINTTNGKR